jgi:hypothetical protein
MRSQDRPRELTGAGPGRSDGAAIRHFALVAAPMATVVSPRAEGCSRATNGLRTSDGGTAIGHDAWPSRVGRRRRDRDRVCGRSSDADRIYRHAKTNLDRNFHNFGQALFWIFNRPTCRVAPLCRGELNGSKFWSAAKYLRRRSRIDVAAAGADLDHDRPDRRGDALASLVKDTRPTARRAAERCPRAARSPKDPSNTLNAVSDALIAVSVQITDLIRYSETVKQQARPLGDGAAFAGVPSPEAVANPFPTSTVAP